MYCLPSINLGAWHSIAGQREITQPEQFACLRIKRAQLAVELRGADQLHPSRGHAGATAVRRRGLPMVIGSEPYRIGVFRLHLIEQRE